jgi:hypothetical protein
MGRGGAVGMVGGGGGGGGMAGRPLQDGWFTWSCAASRDTTDGTRRVGFAWQRHQKMISATRDATGTDGQKRISIKGVTFHLSHEILQFRLCFRNLPVDSM